MSTRDKSRTHQVKKTMLGQLTTFEERAIDPRFVLSITQGSEKKDKKDIWGDRTTNSARHDILE